MRRVDSSVAFEDVKTSPDKYIRMTVMWGGVIAGTINRKNETIISVTQTALDLEKRPTERDNSKGRFLIYYPGFLDPIIYAKGREITVVGTIEGRSTQPIGDTMYEYPTVNAQALHLWKKRPVYRHYHYPYWEPYPFWRHRRPYW